MKWSSYNAPFFLFFLFSFLWEEYGAPHMEDQGRHKKDIGGNMHKQ